ncbi:hypothetical protein PsYK624_016150 [Phanerochaete sordida]|uniref:Uncharacterized protein n=1 Tax=Phanerochaete sordida TaxID=48140 RepID=A0A9P3FZM4_9APHY|nr:hypothetical protein PsYK624_016150 [Phanerochaete sordida]
MAVHSCTARFPELMRVSCGLVGVRITRVSPLIVCVPPARTDPHTHRISVTQGNAAPQLLHCTMGGPTPVISAPVEGGLTR